MNVNPAPVPLVVVFGAKLKDEVVVTAAAGTLVFGAKLNEGAAVTAGAPTVEAAWVDAAGGAGVDWLNGLVKSNNEGVSGTDAVKLKNILYFLMEVVVTT